MNHDLANHHRRSIRLRGYDYRQTGAYFVTICAQSRECLFGDVIDRQVRENEIGAAARDEWLRSADIRREIGLDAFVVMPNHLHGIVVIRHVGAHGRAPLPPTTNRPPRSLGSFVAGFKSAATRRINTIRGTPGLPVWQRNYYERIVRDDRELDAIRRYIEENPARWAEDPENPSVGAHGHAPLHGRVVGGEGGPALP